MSKTQKPFGVFFHCLHIPKQFFENHRTFIFEVLAHFLFILCSAQVKLLLAL